MYAGNLHQDFSCYCKCDVVQSRSSDICKRPPSTQITPQGAVCFSWHPESLLSFIQLPHTHSPPYTCISMECGPLKSVSEVCAKSPEYESLDVLQREPCDRKYDVYVFEGSQTPLKSLKHRINRCQRHITAEPPMSSYSNLYTCPNKKRRQRKTMEAKNVSHD